MTSLFPARFLSTVGHFLSISMVRQSLNDNIRSSLNADETYPFLTGEKDEYYNQYQTLKQSSIAAINVAFFCFAIDMISLLTERSVLSKRVNFFHAIEHVIGSIFTCWFIGKHIT
jgi:hypothetical protein